MSVQPLWGCAAHILLLHSTCWGVTSINAEKWAVISLSGVSHSHFWDPVYCMMLLSPPLFKSERERREKKWDKLNYKTWDSCWNQTPDSLCVYTASLSSTISLSVTRSLSSLPASVPMTLLLTLDCDASFIWTNWILWPLTGTRPDQSGMICLITTHSVR